MEKNKQKFDEAFAQTITNKYIHEAVLLIENTEGDFSWSKGYGKDIDTPILAASITKLFTTTCIFVLIEQGKISLDDLVTSFFESDLLNKLHMYKGKDYTNRLTIRHLLFQTSGLPDISEQGRLGLRKQAIQNDLDYTFAQMITKSKQLKPHFAPQMGKRAYYANINFDLLGEIIEKVTSLPLAEVYKQFIFEPLKLEKTYLPVHEDDLTPNIYHKNERISRPKYIRSCRASGGGISTTRELMIFTKGFFGGRLFNKKIFSELNETNKLQLSMYPIQYSGGYMSIPLGGLATLFKGKKQLIGHSGSSGSLAFYYSEKDLFFVGDVNQSANPALPIRLAMRLAISV